MARLVYGMMQSLDGYVDAMAMPPPEPALFRHFIERTRDVAGTIYGRGLYGFMRYWEADQPDWDDARRDYAAAWRARPKWVFSRTLAPADVGPHATLVQEDLEAFARRLKAETDGDVEVAGPTIAAALTALGLIDVYQLYLRPHVLGAGEPFFAGPRPPLRLVATDRLGDDTIRLTYEPQSGHQRG